MSALAQNHIEQIQSRIKLAAIQSGRSINEITLLGASKQKPAKLLREYSKQGLRVYGENYLQEALAKQEQLKDLELEWHFIGGIQSNKCKNIANAFNWVHGVDRLKIAQGLSKHRTTENPLNLLIQLNVDDEESKNGVSLCDVTELCMQISALPNIQLRGLMVIPKATQALEQQRIPFKKTRQTLDAINQQLDINMDTLSMGMSSDIEAAILEGSTLVRVGSALFGKRV